MVGSEARNRLPSQWASDIDGDGIYAPLSRPDDKGINVSTGGNLCRLEFRRNHLHYRIRILDGIEFSAFVTYHARAEYPD